MTASKNGLLVKTYIQCRFIALKALSYFGVKLRLTPQNSKNLVKLEIGCGPNLRKGHIGVDIRAFEGVRFLCPAWEVERYVQPSSVDEVFSRHFLEHLTFAQADLTIKSWRTILKSSGKLTIIVPDLDYHIGQFGKTWNSPAEFNSEKTNIEHALAGFWGWQREGDKKMWDVHKSGYNFELLKEELEKRGFQAVHRNDDKPWNLNVSCSPNSSF